VQIWSFDTKSVLSLKTKSFRLDFVICRIKSLRLPARQFRLQKLDS